MRLTEAAKSAGCAGKLGPKELALALGDVPHQQFAEVLVSFENSDDAGIYQLSPGVALVQTVDYFPPIVDDPYTFGRTAAANALSDVYALGGKPKTALSIVGFPALGGDFSILGEIMSGGISVLNNAGFALLGGHSVLDDEIKFGLRRDGCHRSKNHQTEQRRKTRKPRVSDQASGYRSHYHRVETREGGTRSRSSCCRRNGAIEPKGF